VHSYGSEYSTETETLWVKFTALQKEKRSPVQMYNGLSGEIGLSPITLASFYRRQKWPQRILLDKIEAKENRKNSSGRSKNLFLSSANREIIRDGSSFKSNDNNNDDIS